MASVDSYQEILADSAVEEISSNFKLSIGPLTLAPFVLTSDHSPQQIEL
jgi:hypothetical protein